VFFVFGFVVGGGGGCCCCCCVIFVVFFVLGFVFISVVRYM